MAPHDNDGDGWTVGDVLLGDGVFLKVAIRARGWIVEDAAHP